jgi:hypothetical protein
MPALLRLCLLSFSAAHLRGEDNNSDLSCPFFCFSFSFSLRLCRGFGTSSFYFIFPLARGKNRQHVPMSHEKTTYKATSLLLSPLKINKASKVSLLKRRIEKRKSDIGKTPAHIKIAIFKEIVNCFDLKKTTAILRRDLWKWLFFGVCEIELHIQLSFFLKFQVEYAAFRLPRHAIIFSSIIKNY